MHFKGIMNNSGRREHIFYDWVSFSDYLTNSKTGIVSGTSIWYHIYVKSWNVITLACPNLMIKCSLELGQWWLTTSTEKDKYVRLRASCDHNDAHYAVIKCKHFRVSGPLWEESTGHRWIDCHGYLSYSFVVNLNKRLNKHSIDR